MKYVIIGISFFLLTSCHSVKYQSLSTLELNTLSNQKFQTAFHNDTSSHVYDIHIYIQKKHISGLLFFKKIENAYRYSIITKTGQKLVDLSMEKNQLTVHHVMEELNKKIILEQLRKDFQLLTIRCESKACQELKKRHDKELVDYRMKACPPFTDGYVHFFYNEKDINLMKIGVGGKRRPKRWAVFENYNDSYPQHITIDHRSMINLRLELYNLELSKE